MRMFVCQLICQLINNENKQQFLQRLKENYFLFLFNSFNQEIIQIRLYFLTEDLLNIYLIELGINDFKTQFHDIIQNEQIEIQIGEVLTIQSSNEIKQENNSNKSIQTQQQPQHHQDSTERQSNYSNKTSWPELKNTSIDHAISIISLERPDLKVIKLNHGAIVTADMREDRVRVYHRNNIVSNIPRIG